MLKIHGQSELLLWEVEAAAAAVSIDERRCVKKCEN